MSYICKYCTKPFTKEKTLLTHLCEKKRRWAQEHETGVRLGLKSYLKFYERTQAVYKEKSYEDFVESPYYSAFVKFGRYCVDIRCVNFSNFTDWLFKHNKKLDHWCKDSLYTEWLLEYIRKEAVQDALERALNEMQDYADHSIELNQGFSNYFRAGNVNRITHHIVTGRISPWVIYNCKSGTNFLSSLNEPQVCALLSYIEPEYWQRKFLDYPEDTKWVKQVLTVAGL